MFTDLFHLVADYGLAAPAEIAVFRALATTTAILALRALVQVFRSDTG
jgi:hypothetical protein